MAPYIQKLGSPSKAELILLVKIKFLVLFERTRTSQLFEFFLNNSELYSIGICQRQTAVGSTRNDDDKRIPLL